jgi:hypothetical protein
MDENIF